MSDAGGAGAAGAGAGAGGAGGGAGGAGAGGAGDLLSGAGAGGAGGATQAGSGGTDFLATLPEAYRGDPIFQGFKSNEDIYKSFKEVRSLVGANTVKLPAADAKPEELKPIFAKLGLPEKPDGYTLPDMKLPDGVRDEAMEKVAMAKFHELNLLPAQVNGLMEWYYGTGVEGMKAAAAEAAGNAAKARAELEQHYGEAFPERAALVARMFDPRFVPGGDKVYDKLKTAGLNHDPDFFRWVDGFSSKMAEGRLIEGVPDAGLMQTADQARAAIKAIEGNKDHAYWKPDDPGYAAAKAEVTRLYAIANPDKK